MLWGCEIESHHKSIRTDISWKRTQVTYIRIPICLHRIELVTVVLMLIPTRRNTNVFTVDLHWRWNSNVLVNVLSSLKCRGWCTHIVRPFCRFFVLFIPFLFIGSPFPFKIWVFKEMIPFCYPRFLHPRFLLFLGHLVPQTRNKLWSFSFTKFAMKVPHLRSEDEEAVWWLRYMFCCRRIDRCVRWRWNVEWIWQSQVNKYSPGVTVYLLNIPSISCPSISWSLLAFRKYGRLRAWDWLEVALGMLRCRPARRCVKGMGDGRWIWWGTRYYLYKLI